MAEFEQETNNNLSLETNELYEYDYNDLNMIRETIEKMNKFNQIEVLKLLYNHKEVVINENKYGVHINLSEVKNEIIDEIKVYINYVNAQEMTLFQLEEEKEKFKNIYFTKDNKDIKNNNTKINVLST